MNTHEHSASTGITPPMPTITIPFIPQTRRPRRRPRAGDDLHLPHASRNSSGRASLVPSAAWP